MNQALCGIWNAALDAWVTGALRGGRLVTGLLLIGVLATPASAQTTQNWDINGNTAGLGGAGTWDTTNTFWNTSATGTGGTVATWTNGTFDNAVFGGTAGTVTASGSLDVHNITFNTAGYIVSGGTLNLGGATPTITVGAGLTDTISSIIAGSAGLAKAGTGTLSLTGTNTFSGGVNVTAGILNVTGNAALGDVSNGVTMAAGTTLTATTGTNLASSRVVTLSGGTVTLNGSRVSSARFTGPGGITVTGGSFTLSNNANDYTGQTQFSGVGATFSFSSIADLGVASALGAPTTVANGNILVNPTSASAILNYTGTGGSSNRNITSNGTSGTAFRLINAGSGTLTLTGAIALNTGGSVNTLFDANGGDLNLLGVISRTFIGGVVFQSTSGRTITLGNANTYVGSTTVSNATVRAGVLANTGAASSFGTATAGASGTNLTSNGIVSYTGTGSSSNRAWNFISGTLRNDGSGALTLSGTMGLLGAGTLGGNFTGTNSASGVVSGAGALAVNTSGTWQLSGTNTYTGVTTINAGTLQAGAAAGSQAFGNQSAVTLANVTGATLDLNGFDQTIGSLSGGGTTGGNVTLGAGTLTTGGDNTSTTYAGIISGSGGLTKAGSGAMTLSGANSYTGPTTISAGSLYVNGNQTGATGLTSVVSGARLGGSGTIGGDVTVASGGTLGPGNSPGTLTINGNLLLAGGSVLDYEFGQSGTVGGALNDLTVVNGNLTLGGTLNVNVSAGGSFTPGLYRVFNYGGTLTDNGLALGTMPAGSTTFVQTSVANQVNLINTAGMTLNFWDGAAGPKNNNAINGGNGVWRSNTGNDNWTDLNGALNAPFTNASFAIFTGTPGTVTVDTALGAVTSGGMQFAANGYTVTGDALALTGPSTTVRVGDGTAPGVGYTATINSVLTGATQLVKTDLGTLVLGGVNTYTGGTALNGGVVQIASDANLGAAAGGLSFDGATLRTTAALTTNRTATLNAGGGTVDTNGFNVTMGGVISGAGDLTKVGAGTLTLTGTNAYTGATTINAGTLQAGAAAGSQAFGNQSAVTLANVTGATLDLNGFDQTIGSLSGGGTTGGNVTLGAGALTTGGDNSSTTYAGVINGSGGLIKNGSGTLTLSNTSIYTGMTTVNAGTLQAGAASAFSTGSAYTVMSGTTLATAGFNQQVASLTNSGTVSLSNASTGSTLTTTGPYVGNNGILQLGTAIVGGVGVADRLVLNGAGAIASGNTMIQLTNLGGLGVATSGNGIELITGIGGATTTAQTTRNAFQLAGGHVDAGAYEYRLYAADATGAGQNWYLRSSLTAAGQEAVYRAEVPMFAALSVDLRRVDLTMLGNLRRRMGDETHSSILPADTATESHARRAWGRAIDANLDTRRSGTTEAHSDGHATGFQMGTDVLANDDWHAGLYMGDLESHAQITGNAHGVVGFVGGYSVQSRHLGAYATWMDENNFYVDMVLQGGRQSYTGHPDGNQGFSGTAKNLLVSIETGTSIPVNSVWNIEPQFQLTRHHSAPDTATISGADVSFKAVDGWIGRLGVRIKGAFVTSAGRFVSYAQLNLHRATYSDDSMSFTQSGSATTIASPGSYSAKEALMGATLALTSTTSLYGEIGRLWNSGGSTDVKSALQASLGLKVLW